MNQKVIYRAAPGAPFPAKEAPAIGRYLENLERTSGGGITPIVVVKDAKKPSSPLHRYFCWDDTEAARKYRLWQARMLVNHLLVIVEKDGNDHSLKGFHSVKISVEGEKAERSYASLATVDNDHILREQVLQQALKELAYWQMRYGQLEELWEVNKAINRAKKRARAKKAG
jgi:hypothetical protein